MKRSKITFSAKENLESTIVALTLHFPSLKFTHVFNSTKANGELEHLLFIDTIDPIQNCKDIFCHIEKNGGTVISVHRV